MILRLQRTPGIYLVGFMGCGKTLVGQRLAERLGWGFADTDADIEAEQKVCISEIFDTRGEEEFRKLESKAIRKCVRMVQMGKPLVVALGGGAFSMPANYELLENNGVTVWLDCPLSLIRRRIAESSHRPLARDPKKFELLYCARRESYARADYRVEIAGDDPELAVDSVLQLPIL
jgi:shikimate kinase